jgi:hypothetical protein
MSLPGVWPQVLDFFGMPLGIEPAPGQLSSDAGLLLILQFDQRIRLTGLSPMSWTMPCCSAARSRHDNRLLGSASQTPQAGAREDRSRPTRLRPDQPPAVSP